MEKSHQFSFSLPEHSKIWIYQSNRPFTQDEVSYIKLSGDQFIKNWNAHGINLFSELNILYNHFIILAVDEKVAHASGCSIDKSMQFIRDIEKKINIQLTNRLNIALLIEDTIELVPLQSLQEGLGEGRIISDQLFFDNTVQTLGDLKKNWIKPLKNSWLNRFISEKSIIS